MMSDVNDVKELAGDIEKMKQRIEEVRVLFAFSHPILLPVKF